MNRLEQIRARMERRVRLMRQAEAVERRRSQFAEMAVLDPLSEPRYSRMAEALGLELDAFNANIRELDAFLDKQCVPLIKLMGEDFHDALQQHIPALGKTTRLAEIPASFWGEAWRYMLPPVVPTITEFVEEVTTSFEVETRYAALQRFGRPPTADIAYAPEIDTLFIRRL